MFLWVISVFTKVGGDKGAIGEPINSNPDIIKCLKTDDQCKKKDCKLTHTDHKCRSRLATFT